jgi:NAD(P)H dehydrogenase (quinone)
VQDVNAVITFYSRTGNTERLALAAALGVVNGRGNIRLRRLPETADAKVVAADPAWKENAARFDQEYIAPREVDAQWGECLIIATPAGIGADAPQMRAFVDWLTPLGAQGKLAGKLGLAIPSGSNPTENEATLASLNAFMLQVGLIVLPLGQPTFDPSGVISVHYLQALGRRMAEMARALKHLAQAHR